MEFTFYSIVSILVLIIVYFFLITEKVNKVIVTVLASAFLIVMQIFKSSTVSSQEGAFEFINVNDVIKNKP